LGENGASTIQLKMLMRIVCVQSATFQRRIGAKLAVSAALRWVVFCLIECASEPGIAPDRGERKFPRRLLVTARNGCSGPLYCRMGRRKIDIADFLFALSIWHGLVRLNSDLIPDVAYFTKEIDDE
jgi:hypothetical protein